MKYFLVEGNIIISNYMSDDRHSKTEYRLVRAETPDQAEEKYVAHWESRSEQYGRTYWADCTVMETIE